MNSEMRKIAIFLVIANFLVSARSQESGKTILCYLMSWSMYRSGDGKFNVATDVDPFLCTHIVYGFMALDENTNKIKSRDEWADMKFNGKGLISELTRIRDRLNPDLKILASIGGWAEGSKKFSDMVASTAKIDTFVSSIMEFVNLYNLDGIDFCWEFPTDRGGIPEDKRNFVEFLKELKKRLSAKNKILTVYLSAKRYIIDPGYDLPGISRYVDYMNVMNSDYNGPWEKKTGINAPFNSTNEFNTLFSINYLIELGATPSKILMGIPTYGHSVNMLTEPNDGNYIGVPSDSGYKNVWTEERGLVGYNEVCYEHNTDDNWKKFWDEDSKTPFSINRKKFMSYENERSISEKLQIVDLKSLGGVNVWSLDMDDFKSLCQGERFPLTSTIKNTLNKKEEIEEPTTPLPFNVVGIISHPHG